MIVILKFYYARGCSLHSHIVFNAEVKSMADDSSKLNVNLDNILIQLRSQVTPVWYQFGEAAGIGKDVLDSFAKQCSPEDCIVEMLDYWLRKHVRQPTWIDIANILKLINLPQLAAGIERVHITGTEFSYAYCSSVCYLCML